MMLPVRKKFVIDGSHSIEELQEWMEKLRTVGCFPIPADDLVVTSHFTDDSGIEQVQVFNKQTFAIACCPKTIALRIFHMGIIMSHLPPTIQQVEQVVEQVEPRVAEPVLKCDQCDRDFLSKKGLTQHIARVHGQEKDAEFVIQKPKRARGRPTARIRKHSAFLKFVRHRKEFDIEEGDWKKITQDQRKIFENLALEANYADGFLKRPRLELADEPRFARGSSPPSKAFANQSMKSSD